MGGPAPPRLAAVYPLPSMPPCGSAYGLILPIRGKIGKYRWRTKGGDRNAASEGSKDDREISRCQDRMKAGAKNQPEKVPHVVALHLVMKAA
jgi:hypothetical protein